MKRRRSSEYVLAAPSFSIEPLDSDQKLSVSLDGELKFTAAEWEAIERGRSDFVWSRKAQAEQVKLDDICRVLGNLSKACEDLMTAVGGQRPNRALSEPDRILASMQPPDPVTANAWAHIKESGFSGGFSDTRGIIQDLDNSAFKALKRLQNSKGDAWSNEFSELVHYLVGPFEAHGKVTASPTSKFVQYAWAFMDTLPSDIRMHTFSGDSFAKAVQRALREAPMRGLDRVR
jgi:hypothetical protein